MATIVTEPDEYGSVNLSLRVGSTYRRTLIYQSGETPIDLTGWSARMQIREGTTLLADLVSAGDPDPTALVSGTLTLGGVAGTIVRLLTADQTAKLPVGVFPYDLKYTDSTGDEHYLLVGQISIEGSVTP